MCRSVRQYALGRTSSSGLSGICYFESYIMVLDVALLNKIKTIFSDVNLASAKMKSFCSVSFSTHNNCSHS